MEETKQANVGKCRMTKEKAPPIKAAADFQL